MDDDQRSRDAPLWSTSAEDLARVIAKRPGMYLGGASYERAVGFLTGVASIVSTPSSSASPDVAPDEFSAGRSSDLLVRLSALEHGAGVDDHEAILTLEPLLAEVLTALQHQDEASPRLSSATGPDITTRG
ncbi:hypothetical protein SAMN05443377_10731 [Propionibacterium cyclohexanicum]|uniref:Uncharacterized protein n=1 Tax=Propionibacterium cyclohexanicum TaxID=64702 RepID=A0A1H9RFQ8_9ACTN|nr:hypothetical protein [Propionibacterium cyclohexanicum]SER71504.1 hypothetical protein SAMN05443377_10731 [Propionibacterium cyclohexanicum]